MLVDLLWQRHTWILNCQLQFPYSLDLAEPPNGNPRNDSPYSCSSGASAAWQRTVKQIKQLGNEIQEGK